MPCSLPFASLASFEFDPTILYPGLPADLVGEGAYLLAVRTQKHRKTLHPFAASSQFDMMIICVFR